MSQNQPVKITCTITVEIAAGTEAAGTAPSTEVKKAMTAGLIPTDTLTINPPGDCTGLSFTATGSVTPYCAVVSGTMTHIACGLVYKGQPPTQSGQNTWSLTFGGATNPLLSGKYSLNVFTQSGTANQSATVNMANGSSYSCP